MSIWVIMVISIVLALCFWSKKNAKEAISSNKTPRQQPSSFVAAASQPNNVFESAAPRTFELIDFTTEPRLRVGSNVLQGNKMMILWDSERINQLRKQFQVKNVLDRIEFKEGPNVIEVYRGVSDNLYTFVFPDANTDEVIQLNEKFSEDPSEKKVTPKKEKTMWKEDTSINIPPELIETIRQLDVTYSKRQSASGPKAVDTHSQP